MDYNLTYDEKLRLRYNAFEETLPPEETSDGDVWQVCVTPYNGLTNGSEVCSNNVTVGEYQIPENIVPNNHRI